MDFLNKCSEDHFIAIYENKLHMDQEWNPPALGENMNDFLYNIGVRAYDSKSRCNNKKKHNLNYLKIKYICIGN